ncbi:unnamed protein product [Pleuronectes platessa]|uniref:BRCT domain-containing protein n=1 Tax=Pleuronectes platessa TaxID=8262 RepID=A0A9N7UVZ7_PLEPL|nr:unnamed protein product [Pleuronectes platessa]
MMSPEVTHIVAVVENSIHSKELQDLVRQYKQAVPVQKAWLDSCFSKQRKENNTRFLDADYIRPTWTSGGADPMMLPSSAHSASAPSSHVSQLSRYKSCHYNTPEEDDETMSIKEQEARVVTLMDSTSKHDGQRPLAEHAPFADDSLFSRSLDTQHEHLHNHTLSEPWPQLLLVPASSQSAGWVQSAHSVSQPG